MYPCQTPPGIIRLPDVFLGRLLFCGLSPVLNVEWLRFQGVQLVVNCIGQYSDNKETQLWKLVQKAREGVRDICFKDWCIRSKNDQRFYLNTFAAIKDILDQREGCVLVHCRSGKDRSAFTVYAFLRLMCQLGDLTARAALNGRVDRWGHPVANLDFQQEAQQRWLDNELLRRSRS